jgi:tRNA pseudouridine synthase 10
MNRLSLFKQLIPNVNTAIVNACIEAGCCNGCTLRYLGIKDLESYTKVQENKFKQPFKRWEEDGHHFRPIGGKDIEIAVDLPTEETFEGVCTVCLGILQADYEHLSQTLVDMFQGGHFQVASQEFSLALRVPLTYPIRHQAMVHHIQGDVQPCELKEIVKSLVREGMAGKGMNFDSQSPLVLELHFTHTHAESDLVFLNALPHAQFEAKQSRKRGVVYYKGASVDKILRSLQKITKQDFVDWKMLPPPKIVNLSDLEVHWVHQSIFFAGRYCKLERGISNSKWVIGGRKLAEFSMEELIGDELQKACGGCYKFSSSGREDADVLMLGRGRPFYFEILQPKRTAFTEIDIRELQDKINQDKKIRVFDLQIVSKEDTKVLKDSASSKSKSYQCKVELANPVKVETLSQISEMTNIELKQRNPTRVPRRADLVRDKLIEWIRVSPIEVLDGLAKSLHVEMKTSAGTYVKEFIHGDEGRTIPSFSSLVGCEAKCVQLDVLEIHLDWPPRTE